MAANHDLLIAASKKEISREILLRAKSFFESNPQLRDSLKIIGIDSIEGILCREIWPGSYIEHNFAHAGLQTMDDPRLHYIASKQFFLGRELSYDFFFTHKTARYAQDYLLAKLYGDWGAAEIPKSVYDSIRRSLETDTSPRKKGLPTVRSFILKAYLKDPEQYPLDSREKAAYGVDLLPFIETYPRNENDWKQVNLENRSLRRRAQVLIGKVVQDRNWITPYPIDGLKTLLEKEMLNAPTASEKNWCALQRAIIAVTDERDHKKALSLFSTLQKNKQGKVILNPADENVWQDAIEVLSASFN